MLAMVNFTNSFGQSGDGFELLLQPRNELVSVKKPPRYIAVTLWMLTQNRKTFDIAVTITARVHSLLKSGRVFFMMSALFFKRLGIPSKAIIYNKVDLPGSRHVECCNPLFDEIITNLNHWIFWWKTASLERRETEFAQAAAATTRFRPCVLCLIEGHIRRFMSCSGVITGGQTR